MVKTLYKGCFSDGTFNDDTGESFYITRNDDSPYTYYKGNFVNGKPVQSDTRQIVTVSEIHTLLKDFSFGCELSWYGDTTTNIS